MAEGAEQRVESGKRKAVEISEQLSSLYLKPYDGSLERKLAIEHVSFLLVKLNRVDAALAVARAQIVVLQKTRYGRVDLRTGKSRAVPGARLYTFMKWIGHGVKQHAVPLKASQAGRSVRRVRHDDTYKTEYASARMLIGHCVEALEYRQAIFTAFIELRRVNRRLTESPVLDTLERVTATTKPLATITWETYKSSLADREPARQPD
jgi:hypothetical protein